MPRFSLPVLAALGASLCGAASLPMRAQAQNQPPAERADTTRVVGQIANVTDANFATLPALLPRRAAISLNVTAATLDEAPGTRDALLDWTRNGGLVFLHNDAARLFGYRTVEARPGNNRQAGQIFGRAKRALPFASHPLLQGAKAVTTSTDPTRLPGVNVVFYQMKEGDHLVVSHPAGMPILEATDLAATLSEPLYACAIAPFGRGFAVFTPDFIDQTRADGATFAANLLALLPASVPATTNNPTAVAVPADAGAPKYVGVSQVAIDSGAPALIADLRRALSLELTESPALPPLGALPAPVTAQNAANGEAAAEVTEAAPLAPVGAPVFSQPPVLMLTRAEALGVQTALQSDSARTLAILRTRIAILRGDIPAANQQLATLIQSAPAAAETAFLNGILNANLAGDVALPSPQRSAAARTAADEFTRSANARPIIPVATRGAAGMVTQGNPEAVQLSSYASELGRLSRLYSFDPPLATSIDRNGESIVIRYGPGDSAYPLVLNAAQLISSSRVLGWRSDQQEILLFPSEQTYVAYRAASGQRGQNVPLPAASGGDVVGSRILMATAPAGLAPLTLGFLARLQTYALLTAWFDGGGRAPAWLTIGLENMVSNLIGAQLLPVTNGQTLEQFAQAGGLLTPAQFEAGRAAPSDIASIQATALVNYFYTDFGPGAVTETIQRLAAGQSSEEALGATTGLDQLGFFQSWRNARFGPRNFPNAG